MTVSTEISSNEYTGNGVTTDFDYKFRIFKANQLSVITSDADGDNVVTLRLGTDYTVTDANKPAGGKVILTKPLANGHKISIARDIPITQETSFRNQSKFFAETHENAFDYLTMILQSIWGSLGSLYLKRPNILANWFDAKGYRIANLAKPKRDSDAVDLGTLKDEISVVNSTILKKEKRTLRVDDMDIPAFPKVSDRRNKQVGFNGLGYPTLLDPVETGALGYQLVDSFEKGATLTSRYQALFWEQNKTYYRWDGELPKQVPANSTPNDTGGIKTQDNPNGLWVDIGDLSLRHDLEIKGTEIVKDRNGKSVEERFDESELKAKEGKYRTLSSVRIFAELPLQPSGYQDIINQYGYQYIYPQGMCFFENDLYINCSGVGGVNSWSWIYVYDRNSLELKSIFSAGDTSSEGLHVTRVDGKIYLFILEKYSGSRGGKTGVYEIPDSNSISSINMQRLTALRVCSTSQYFQIGGYGNQLVIEINSGSSAAQAIHRRTKFNYYNANDLINSDNPDPIGSVSVNVNLERVGKRQGVTLTPDGLIMGYGSYIPYGAKPDATHIYAFRMAGFTGSEIKSFTADPNNVCDILNPYLRNKATRMENEGVAYSDFNGIGRIFSLNITGNSTQEGEAAGGLLVLEQNVSPFDKDTIDISSAVSMLGCIDENNDTSILLQDRLFDRLQNKQLETLEQILDRMNRDGVQTCRFYNGYTPYVKDINGDEITPSCSVTVENMNSYTYVVTVSGNRTFYQMLITGDRGGPYTQRMGTFIQSPETTVRPEFLKRHTRILGVDGGVSENIYTNNPGSVTISRYYSGDNANPQLSGSIVVNGNNRTTSFNTTSDEEAKLKHGIDVFMPDLISEAVRNGAAQKAAFKTSPDNVYCMFMAQTLHKYFPEAVYVGSNVDTDPWQVDATKLVASMMIAIAQMNDKLNSQD